MNRALPGLMAAAALLLSACATPASRVILLAGPDGKVGKVAVINADQRGETVLAQANATAVIDTRGGVETATATAEQLAGFDAVRKALPARPAIFVLFFKDDSDELTEASNARLPEMLREVAARPAVEVVIIGHSDTAGTLEYNDALSLARANVVRNALLALKISPQQVRVEGRGERELLMKTADEVREAANRRVEISVR